MNDHNRQPQPAAHAKLVTRACRFIESAESTPELAEVAAHCAVSESHLQRTFKRVTGVTPLQYGRQVREQRARGHLERGDSVTRAIDGAGYASTSRFYERTDAMLGMTPTAYRTGGADVAIRFAVGRCSLGSVLVAASDRGVCAILLGDDPEELVHDLERRFPRADLLGGEAGFEQLVARVVGLVEDPGAGHELPLDIRGTAFQQRVWSALAAIPAGTTASYAQIAKTIGAPAATRAVAQACGANRLAVAIPCHRVVRADGSLSGYRWGVERKAALLEREAARTGR